MMADDICGRVCNLSKSRARAITDDSHWCEEQNLLLLKGIFCFLEERTKQKDGNLNQEAIRFRRCRAL